MKTSSPLIIALSALAISGCSGGGSNDSAAPSGPNLPPVFTSGTTATTPENNSGTVYTATATDPNGDPVQFSLFGGDDSFFFTFDGNGVIRFRDAPDFETPLDADFDNTYELTLAALDSANNSVELTVNITVTDVQDSPTVRYVDQLFPQTFVLGETPYATVGGQTLAMNIVEPLRDRETQRPVIIFAFGGGFIQGDKDEITRLAIDYAKRGYVAAAIDYRILSRTPTTELELLEAGAAATQDLFGAVRFFREDAAGENLYSVRSDAIFVAGESAGAVMALNAAIIDPNDTFSDSRLTNYFARTGGVYGDVGGRTSFPSAIQGALSISGAAFDLSAIDANSAPLYLAHEEFDSVVPCDTAAEGATFTGLIVSGSCVVGPAYDAAGAVSESFIVAGSVGHLDYTDAQEAQFLRDAAQFLLDEAIDP